MSKNGESKFDPQVAEFFLTVVAEAIQTITGSYLKPAVRTNMRIGSDSAEILIYFDPGRDYRGYFYRLSVRDGVLWRKSFYTNQTHVTPVSNEFMVKYDYSIVTPEQIVADFATQYRDERATKPLGEPSLN